MSKSTKPRPMSVPFVTLYSLEMAARRSIRAVQKRGCTKASTDAGFLRVTGKHPNRRGYQIFVTAEPWSDEAFIDIPESGGLVNEAREIVYARAEAAAEKAVQAYAIRLAKQRELRRKKRKATHSKKGGAK